MKKGSGHRAVIAVITFGLIAAGWFLLETRVAAPPSPALADEIDRILVRQPCVGPIEDWTSREYVWRSNRWSRMRLLGHRWLGSDTSVVHVDFHRGGDPRAFKPGRHLLRPDQRQMIFSSDPDLYTVFADYDVRAKRLTEFHCGPNYPDTTPGE